ncbi:hypothetical protein [Pseudoduganella sp. RAF53_2]
MTDQDHVDQDDDEGQSPKFGRLLVILLLVVALIGVLTFATEAYYT